MKECLLTTDYADKGEVMEKGIYSNKVFISHSSLDLAYVKPFVELLEFVGANPSNMFCSSVSNYNIPLDYNIFDYLRDQFQNYNLRVIYFLSKNYYNSPVCLAEMGAAWVLQQNYTCILLPGFDFHDIKGVIDQMRISIKIDGQVTELNQRLDELKNIIRSEFGMTSVPFAQNRWEEYRNNFIMTSKSINTYWDQIKRLRDNGSPIEDLIDPLKRLLKASPTSYDAMYLLGRVYIELEDIDNAISCLNAVLKYEKTGELHNMANKMLRSLGYPEIS